MATSTPAFAQASHAPVPAATEAQAPPPTHVPLRCLNCPCPPNSYLHDGFYMRAGFGTQYTRIFGEREGQDAALGVWGMSLVLAFGGTPAPGLVVGGMFTYAGGGQGTFKGAPMGAEKKSDAGTVLLGPFIDWFPSPRGMWHLGGAVGISGHGINDGDGNDFDGTSAGAMVYAGADFWAGPAYSSGLALVLYGALPADADGYRLAAVSTGLQWSLLYH